MADDGAHSNQKHDHSANCLLPSDYIFMLIYLFIYFVKWHTLIRGFF